jgi:hypothetical protein
MAGILFCICLALSLGRVFAAPAGEDLPTFDFTRAEVCQQWGPAHDIAQIRPVAEGLEATITGEDPYLYGPARNYPEGKPLWLLLKVKSEEGGPGQVFFFRDQAREENSARFSVEAGKWTEVRLGIPALGAGYRLRLDPPGTRSRTIIASIRFTSAAPLAAPQWPKPSPADFSRAARLRSGPLELLVTGEGFRLWVEGKKVADSHTRPLIGYAMDDKMRWVDIHSARQGEARVEAALGQVTVSSVLKDEDGAHWQLAQKFSPSAMPGAIDFEMTVESDREREVAFLPLVLLTAWAGEADTSKQQGLFAGLDYLDSEPSSSQADIVGPESRRQVPANHKITFPLMAVVREDRYVGLVWDHTSRFSALFDSPDRLLGTEGHLMGVLFPGSDGYNRSEGALMPARPETLAANRPLSLKGQLVGGRGASAVPAVAQYVKLRGLPAMTPNGYSFPDYVSLASHGWLDSKAREGNLFRHAVWPGFGAQPAADAAMFMDWLADKTTAPERRRRLTETARSALAGVKPADLNLSGVSHVRYPVQSLVYGQVAENASAAEAQARSLLARFEADGSILYRKSAGHEDYGRTHFAPEANGLTAQVVESFLQAATVCGDRALIEQALDRLRGLNKFRDTVPRGAQTWEVPLHTPDILASAHLVRAYTLGYELTGEKDFIAQAVYWAWTGVPFVYLITPVGFPDRPYGTIAVYGATGWRAPVWFGRPVQWCGLVYADALYRLIRHDPAGPWKQLADGITSVGIHYSWPPSDINRQGLLPDVWEMLAQRRDGPAINPGTVQVNAARLFGGGPFYDFRVLRLDAQRILVHAPGEIAPTPKAGALQFKVLGWPTKPYFVLANGFTRMPRITINGRPASPAQGHQFQEKPGRLILRLSGQPTVNLQP